MKKQYIGSDEHWIDSVNQRYDEQEARDREQERQINIQPDHRQPESIQEPQRKGAEEFIRKLNKCSFEFEDSDGITHLPAIGLNNAIDIFKEFVQQAIEVSDEEIAIAAFNLNQVYEMIPNTITDGCWIEGAKWYRNKIKGTKT